MTPVTSTKRFSFMGALFSPFMAFLIGAMLLPMLALGQSIRQDSFNHLTTGFPLTGVHQQAKCETCHVQGIFKGTPKDCVLCHGPAAKISSVIMPQTHIPVTERCDNCHTTQKFYGVRFNHASVMPGNCTQCHNGVTAPGKPSGHIVTTASCDSCHRVMVWLPAGFNHSNVAPGSCAQCHNGAGATGKSATHLQTATSCDSCHTTISWQPATKFDHVGVLPGTCAQCHDGTHAPGKKPGHVPTNSACDACHAPTGWLPAHVDHSAVVPGTCAQCHDSKSATGKKVNHIPTTDTCDTCHRTTAWKPTLFAHKGVAQGTCQQCHNGTIAVGKPVKHLVTSSSCDSCHTIAGWLPAHFNHEGVKAGTCGGCHNGTTASGRTGNHIPVSGNACDSCHGNTGYATWSGTLMNHAAVQGVACTTCHESGLNFFGGTVVTRPTPKQDPNHPLTGDCGACHNTSVFDGVIAKPLNHLPTTQACFLCHTDPTNYKTYSMSHQGISGNCSQCHGPGLSFATNFVPRAAPPNHIPYTGSTCESCHSTSNFSSFGGTPMNHSAVSAMTCATCHETGKTFFGVTMVTRANGIAIDPGHPATGDCLTCHSIVSFKGAGVKPPNHLPTSQPCTLCHANPPNFKSYTMNHQGINSNCSQCHGPGLSFATNFVPRGAPPATHIPTSGAACEACHSPSNFTSFGGTPMTPAMHSVVAAQTCATCHETGKTFFGVTMVTRANGVAIDPGHPATGDCSTCHSTVSFKGAGVKPLNHLPTSQPCTLCHANPPNYKTYSMNHQGISSNCTQCHGPGLVFATNFVPRGAPPATHIPRSGAACEACHSPSNFTTFSGTIMTPAAHTAVAGAACTTCHETGKTFFGVTMVTRANGLAVSSTHPATGDCGGACHNTTSFQGLVSKPGNHIPTTLNCSLCHSNPANYKTYSMTHQGISNNCSQCHGPGLVFATNFVPKAPPPNHIPVTGIACEGCHNVNNFTTFSGTVINHAVVAAIPCTTCHETGKAFFGVTMVTRANGLAVSSSHPPAGECGNSGCHNTTSFKGAATKPINHLPTTQTCSLCHSNPANYKTYAMDHQGISGGCTTCHGPGLVFATNFVPKGAPPPTHIPTTGIACESCHSASNFTSFSGTVINHTAVAATRCDVCHETGKTFFGVTMVTRPTPAADPSHPVQGVGGDCVACHVTTSFKTGVGKPINHLPTSQACALCHSNPANYKTYAMNHQGITSNCSQCHGPGLVFATNFTPKGFPPSTHIPTSGAACEACHSPSKFTTFGGTVMTTAMHTVVAAQTCANCHETGKTFFGVTMVTRANGLAKSPSHPPTGDCIACHSTSTFVTATKPLNHIPTSLACATCHTTGDYSKYVMSHQGITSNCAQCHGPNLVFATNFVPKAPPPKHIPYTAACEFCHAPANFTTFSGTKMNHTGTTTGCDQCHGPGLTFFGTSPKAPPTSKPHIPYAGAECEACHAPTNYTSWGGTRLNATKHAVVASLQCMACHEFGMKTMWYGIEVKERKNATHFAGLDCDGSTCHTPQTFSKRAVLRTPGAPASMVNTLTKPFMLGPVQDSVALPGAAAVPIAKPGLIPGAKFNHAGVIPGGCSTCHNGSTAAPMKPARHLQTLLSCDSCHRTTTWIPAHYTHTGVPPGTCFTCHNGAGASGKPANHVLTVASCDTCHRTMAWFPPLPGKSDAIPMAKPMTPSAISGGRPGLKK